MVLGAILRAERCWERAERAEGGGGAHLAGSWSDGTQGHVCGHQGGQLAGAALSNGVKGPRPLAGYGRGAGRGLPWDDCCSRVTWSWSACPQCSSRSLHHPQLLVSCLAQGVTHHKAQALGSLSAGDPFGFLRWTQQLPACSAPALQPSSCLASLFLTAVQRLMPRCPAKCSVPIPNMAHWGGPAQITESQRGGVGRDL